MAKKKYREEDFPLLAQDYARRGLNDEQIAKKLGISIRSYYEYQKKYPQFLQAIKKGKSPVDVMVENALLKRALGFEYEEIHTEYRIKDKKKEKKRENSKVEEEPKAIPVVIKKIKKIAVPDVAACFIWCKNRRPKRWRDKQELEFPGLEKILIKSEIPRPKDKKKANARKKNH